MKSLAVIGSVMAAATASTAGVVMFAVGIGTGVGACSDDGSAVATATASASAKPPAVSTPNAATAKALSQVTATKPLLPGSASDVTAALNAIRLPPDTQRNIVLWNEIYKTVGSAPRLFVSETMTSYVEAKYRNINPGAGSDGPWQIQLTVHKEVTPAEAQDPIFSTHWIQRLWLPAYVSQSAADLALWTSNPVEAAANLAFNAEHPAEPYWIKRHADVLEGWHLALQIVHAFGIDTSQWPDTGGLSIGVAGAASSNPCTSSDTTGVDGAVNFVSVASGKYANIRNNVVAQAARMLRVRYSFGAGGNEGTSLGQCSSGAGWNDCHVVGIDCSGLVMWAYHQAKVYDFPHLAADQYQLTRGFTVVQAGGDPSQAQPGDLVFFEGAESPGHVAIYVGSNTVIQAPQSGDVVKYTKLSDMDPFTAITDPIAWRAAAKAA